MAQNSSSTVSLDLNSVPSGAKLYRTHPKPEFLGYLPYKFTFPRDQFIQKLDANGCATTASFKLEWASGAVEQIGSIPLCLGADVNYSKVFERPKDAPGLEKDIEFAQLMQRKNPSTQEAIQVEAQAVRATNDEDAAVRAFHTAHPNAVSIIRTQQFKNWIANQPPQIKNMFQNGQTAAEAMVVMDSYNAYLRRVGTTAREESQQPTLQAEPKPSMDMGWFLGNLLTGMAEGSQRQQQRQSQTPLRCTSKRTISGSVETVCE